MVMKKVLFVCVGNSARSQMAESFFNKLVKGKAVAVSAGTKPAARINSTAVAAMREVGVTMANQKPKLLTPELLDSADRVITMGCNISEACPDSSVPTEDWELTDPKGKPIEEVRQIRDQIKTRVEVLVKELYAT